MRINTKFAVAVHVMALIELNKEKEYPSTSELLALSVGTNPVVIRQLMALLKRAGLVETQNGVPGSKLAKMPEEISLLDIYKAVQKQTDTSLFDFHPNPNPKCPVGRNIAEAMEKPLSDAQEAMENVLKSYSLKDITTYIVKKHI